MHAVLFHVKKFVVDQMSKILVLFYNENAGVCMVAVDGMSP